MQRQSSTLISCCICLVMLACQTSTDEQQQSPDSVDQVQEVKRVQAILKVQPFPFDKQNKSQVKAPYESKKSIIVPTDLAPQNKWVMFEGPVLENDLIAYRFYMDSRHRNDIYGKLVNDLVMDTVGWNYHNINDWGSDILKVNQSLGIGSPAIYYKDSLYTISQHGEKVVEITEETHDFANIRTTFRDVLIDDQKLDIEQNWSIRTGEPWCEIELKVLDGELPEAMQFATGIVKHIEELDIVSESACLLAFTWGKQSFHKENMGMGIAISAKYAPQKISNIWSHTYTMSVFENSVKYRFLAAWERDVIQVKSADQFKTLIKQACN